MKTSLLSYFGSSCSVMDLTSSLVLLPLCILLKAEIMVGNADTYLCNRKRMLLTRFIFVAVSNCTLNTIVKNL